MFMVSARSTFTGPFWSRDFSFHFSLLFLGEAERNLSSNFRESCKSVRADEESFVAQKVSDWRSHHLSWALPLEPTRVCLGPMEWTTGGRPAWLDVFVDAEKPQYVGRSSPFWYPRSLVISSWSTTSELGMALRVMSSQSWTIISVQDAVLCSVRLVPPTPQGSTTIQATLGTRNSHPFVSPKAISSISCAPPSGKIGIGVNEKLLMQ